MRIRIAAPATLDAFFTELRNKWLEAGGNMNSQIYSQQPAYPTTIPTPIYQRVKGQNPDKSRFYIELLAERFGYPDEGSRDIKTMCDFIDLELSNKLGFHANKRKTSRKVYKVKKTSKKKSVRHCLLYGRTGYT